MAPIPRVRVQIGWVPSSAIAIAAAFGGYVVGRIVERLGPIGAASAPAHALLWEAVVALAGGALAVAAHRDRSWNTATVAAGLVLLGTCIGTYLAFNTLAGSKDCPGTQDCDTLIVPVLMPLVVAAAVGASLGAAGMRSGLARVKERSRR